MTATLVVATTLLAAAVPVALADQDGAPTARVAPVTQPIAPAAMSSTQAPGAPLPAASTSATMPPAPQGKPGAVAYQYRPARFAGRAGQYYKYMWGIDQLVVRESESGQMLKFTWRVVDPARAAALNDKQLEPSLVAPERGVSLVVPVLDKIGQMRQTISPEAGRTYWMAFSNKGHVIRKGDRVDVVVGTFRAEGLVVD